MPQRIDCFRQKPCQLPFWPVVAPAPKKRGRGDFFSGACKKFLKMVSCCSVCTWRPEGTHAMGRARCLKQLRSGDAVRSPSTGQGQRLGRGPGGEAPGSSRDFLISEVSKWLRILCFQFLHTLLEQHSL